MKKAYKYIWMILVLGISFGITACGAATTSEDDNVEVGSDNSTNTEAALEENEDIVVSENTEDSETEENKDEIAEETEAQSVVYEGIDMDSTLPGLEWMDTFDGIIHEPKIVVFNDETNKKVIVENGDTVEFALSDTIAAYVPADKESSAEYDFSGYFKNYECVGRYTVETELQSGIHEVGIAFDYVNFIIYGDEEVKLWCKIETVE